LPPLLFLTCLVVGGLLDRCWPLAFVLPSFGSRIASALLLFGSATVLMGSALVVMQRAGTTHQPGGTPSALVSSGPFRLTRNPLYLSLLLMLAGFAALFNSVWLILAVAVLLVLLNAFIVPREEALLNQLFGTQYSAYCRRVRRWL
jgi:protein-S-isoprenylcysteine O-methyltransferase Ste14